jgi:hypothetical protein
MSCNNFYRRKAINITYSKSVSVDLVIQCAMRMRHIFICGLYGSTAFFHIISRGAIFGKKKILSKKCVFGSSLQICPKHFLF